MNSFNLPNSLTIVRFLAVPVEIWLIGQGLLPAAFWLFVAAGLTDILDGFLARVLNARTELGGYLDPLADKAMLVAVYISLGYFGYLTSWLVIMVVFRDILIVGGVVLFQLTIGKWQIEPLKISKLNTLAQTVLASVVLGGPALDLDVRLATELLIWIVAVTTVASGFGYLFEWNGHAARVRGENHEEGKGI